MSNALTLFAHSKPRRLFDSLSAEAGKHLTLKIEENCDSVLDRMARGREGILLLDLTMYGEDPQHPSIDALLNQSCRQKLLLMTEQSNKLALYDLFGKGARGFCRPDISSTMLLKALQAMDDGELWIGRKLTAYFMGRLHLDTVTRGDQKDAMASLASTDLTLREIEAANLVAKGYCDKDIAKELDISPNTVKNHLRNTYQKLNVANRCQLALLCNGVDLEEEQRRYSQAS